MGKGQEIPLQALVDHDKDLKAHISFSLLPHMLSWHTYCAQQRLCMDAQTCLCQGLDCIIHSLRSLVLLSLCSPQLLQVNQLSYTCGKHIPAGVQDAAIDPAAHALYLLDLRTTVDCEARLASTVDNCLACMEAELHQQTQDLLGHTYM